MTMKEKYNNVIDWIITVILVIPLFVLVGIKYLLKVVAKVVKAMRTIVQVSIVYIRTLREELVKTLSIKV